MAGAGALSHAFHPTGGKDHPYHRGRARPGGPAMNPYLLTQAPLIGGFTLLLLLASIRPMQKESLSNIISILALAMSAVFIWLFLPENAEYFGGAIRVTAVGKVLSY